MFALVGFVQFNSHRGRLLVFEKVTLRSKPFADIRGHIYTKGYLTLYATIQYTYLQSYTTPYPIHPLPTRYIHPILYTHPTRYIHPTPYIHPTLYTPSPHFIPLVEYTSSFTTWSLLSSKEHTSFPTPFQEWFSTHERLGGVWMALFHTYNTTHWPNVHTYT